MNSHGKDKTLLEWQRNVTDTLSRSLRGDQGNSQSPRPAATTIRVVTPDQDDSRRRARPTYSLQSRSYDSSMSPPQTSPRTIPGGEKPRDRRQGLVFNDTFNKEMEEEPSTITENATSRHATRGNDAPMRQRSPSTNTLRNANRTASINSTHPMPYLDTEVTVVQAETRRSPRLFIRSQGEPSSSPAISNKLRRITPSQKEEQAKLKKGSDRRLVKRPSRTSSPAHSPIPSTSPPSVGSLAFPIPTANASKVLGMMRTHRGRTRGGLEYQVPSIGRWCPAVCNIDEIKEGLICESDERVFGRMLVADLRHCQVTASNSDGQKCLEVSSPTSGDEVWLRFRFDEDFDKWLAALLSWHSMAPSTRHANSNQEENVSPSHDERRNEFKTRFADNRSSNDAATTAGAAVIKVGQLLLWNERVAAGSAPKLSQMSPKFAKPSQSPWRRVSCILQDNGEVKLLTENDVTLLAVIQLSQLTRSAIQQLDRSVLDEEFCIGIFPQYTTPTTTISIIKPVYIALETLELFEVWFVLLRAFATPEIYGSLNSSDDRDEFDLELVDGEIKNRTNGLFRVEKSLSLLIIEGTIRMPPPKIDPMSQLKTSKGEQDNSIGNYYVEVLLGGEIRARTMTKRATKKPFWREDVEIPDLPPQLPGLHLVLKRVVGAGDVEMRGFRSTSSIHSPDPIQEIVCGIVEIRLDMLEKGVDVETRWPILDEKQENIGEILLKVRHDELAVLMAADYQPLAELLHRFSNGLTEQIAQTLPSKLRRLAEILMNIFQVSGKSREWLNTLIEDQVDGPGKDIPVGRLRFNRRVGSNDSFDSVTDREQSVRDMGRSLAGEANLLFRGNSLLTQALDFHMKRLAKDYLEDVLGENINEINYLNPECEVDPSRLPQGEDLERNWAQLDAMTTKIWKGIIASANRCPAELRHILKYIRAVAEDRYGDFLRTVSYTSVSGFLFLRFFCPAILNPKLFGLVPDHPRPKAQRALTLIAKSLQVLANLSTFGQKEEWMVPMNRFLAAHKQELKDFIDTVCSIPTERHHHNGAAAAAAAVAMTPASYSTPVTILARLPALSREGFPSLPFLIDQPRNFAALIRLWLDSMMAGSRLTATAAANAEPFEQGDLREFNELCVALQARTDEYRRRAEQEQSAQRRAGEQQQQQQQQPTATPGDEAAGAGPEPARTRPGRAPVEGSPGLPPASSGRDSSLTASNSDLRGSSAAAAAAAAAITTINGSDSEALRERRERQRFWEQTFGRDHHHHHQQRGSQQQQQQQRLGEHADSVVAGVSPPSRGASRNSGKQQQQHQHNHHKGFLSGFRRMGLKDGQSLGAGGSSGQVPLVQPQPQPQQQMQQRERSPQQAEMASDAVWGGTMI